MFSERFLMWLLCKEARYRFKCKERRSTRTTGSSSDAYPTVKVYWVKHAYALGAEAP